MKYILLQKALRYKKRKEVEELNSPPEVFLLTVLLVRGLITQIKPFCVQSKGFKALGTKNEDIETGEDQKGQ